MATRKIIRPATSGNTGASAAPATATAAAPAPASARTLNLSGFVEQLRKQTDSARVQKATSMLQSDRFQLFDEVSDEHVTGVVKSQTDYSLFYACKIDKHGNFMCCTQNLNRCGGLSGNKPCKHMLVLMIGLVQGGKIDATRLSEWTNAAKGKKPVIDKDAMSATFVKYKGAEAGEIEWRPTETTPEDYYAL
ncbi:hypothetical protein F0U59_01335 [Archangium gephyra]|uniref:hypothetical protein n=1 Tax=Archangium violaceum TaxID=83451 RepID=UPI002B2D7D1A|nr:hypothetical protein F0U59_01335 [Archangium gephyra]